MDAAAIARTILAATDGGGQIEPFTANGGDFSEADAYAVTAELRALRVARGERPVGRKIGFTNRNIWDEYGVFQPIWGDVYDTTALDVWPGDRVQVSQLPEPRIEPEIVLGLARDVTPDMGVGDISQSIGWVAHGFEFVQSIFPGWRFQVADCVADGGLHGRLFIGPRRDLSERERSTLASDLSALTIRLSRNGEPADTGSGANVLDGPIQALAHLAAGKSYDFLLRHDVKEPSEHVITCSATYTASDGTKQRPVMIHRALFGSIERFFAVLLEHYAGAFPAWLAPVQVVAIPVTDDQEPAVREIAAQLRSRGIRIDVDAGDDRMQKKIRTHTLAKVPFLVLAGARDVEAGAVSFRFRDGSQRNGVPVAEAIELITGWIARRENASPTAATFAMSAIRR